MYSIEKLTLATECDVLLNWAQNEKEDLELKSLNEIKLTKNYSNTSVSIDVELQTVAAEIGALTAVTASLPEGDTKEETTKKLKKLEYRKFLLENRKESYGVVALLEKQLDVQRIAKELEEVNTFIAGVTAHKATLPI